MTYPTRSGKEYLRYAPANYPETRDRGVGKPSNRAVPVTFSFGGLDIRHRLPDRKGRGKRRAPFGTRSV
jgi:hypothetical protein